MTGKSEKRVFQILNYYLLFAYLEVVLVIGETKHIKVVGRSALHLLVIHYSLNGTIILSLLFLSRSA